jgi:hypothetical protein
VATARGRLFEERAPSGERVAPAAGELLVREPGRPELPEDADVPRPEILAQVRAGGTPLRGQGFDPGVERPLALEQTLVLVLEHGGQQPALAAEVVVDERELHARALRDRAHGRPSGTHAAVQLHGRLGDPSACLLHTLSSALHLVFSCHGRNYCTSLCI